MNPLFTRQALLAALLLVLAGLPGTAHAQTTNLAPGAPTLLSAMASPPPRTTQPPQPRRDRPKGRLSDGRQVIANELKVTLEESAARILSLDAAGESRSVDLNALRSLHPDIAAIEARHLSSRNWLNGDPLPEHSRQPEGGIPRIARNFSVILRPDADVTLVREALREHPQVERADFKEITTVDLIPNDPDYARQWAPAITGLESAWDVPGRGRIIVAVVDTGAQLTHPEFAGRVVWDDGFADFDNGEAPGAGGDFDHGTHVAGIIGAEINNAMGVAGYSNDIDLMIMNCATWDDDDDQWKISDADDAIDEAVARGARIINCSFGFGEYVEDEVESAYDAGVLVVHAAGNSTNSIAGHWEVPSIALLTVTATMRGGSPTTDVFDASYSNFGPGVDLAAPGTGIFSTVPTTIQQFLCDGTTLAPLGYGCKSGTSMAAPQVSGAAALIMSMNPSLLGNERSTRHLLIRMAEDKGPAGYDEQYGWGVLRLQKSTLQACRDATAFVSSASTAPTQNGNYDIPWRDLPTALEQVAAGGTLILNGGVTDVPIYRYPPITITKACTLSAIPDRPVIIGE
jgi:subtilisin family serine protease